MYTSGALSRVPPSASATVAIAPGMFFAHRVVPSSGSTAMSICGPVSRPTFSPMNSMGASSRSPSPITMVPRMGKLLSSRRMGSTAAWSAAFSLPSPRRRAAATAARSVTRTISSDRMRSSNWCDGISIDDMDVPSVAAGSAGGSLRFLDPDELRLSDDDAAGNHLVEGPAHRVLGGGVGDENDRHRRRVGGILAPVRTAAGVTLHDRFERNLLLGKAGRDGRRGARL